MPSPAIEKRIQDYVQDGWVGHIGSDGRLEFGDGSLRLSQYLVSKYILATTDEERFHIRHEFATKSAQLRAGPEPVRHPDGSMWYGQPGTMSRDNLMALVDGAAVLSDSDSMAYYLRSLKSRWFFTWNTKDIHSTTGWKIPDWCGFECWRRLNPQWPYSKRLACDLATIPPTILRCLIGAIAKDHTSPDQTFILGILNRRTSPTFGSQFVEWIYLTFRDWKSAITSYFKPPTAPPLDEFLIGAVEK